MIKAGVMPAFFYCCTAILFPDRARRAHWVAKMCPRCRKNLLREQNIPFLYPVWVRRTHWVAKMCPRHRKNLLLEQNIPFLCPVWVRQAHWVAKMCPRCRKNLLREKFLQKTATETAALLQFYSLAHKPFFFDGLQYLGEGFKEVAGAFDGVVEDDYGAGLKVGDYVAGAGVAVDVAVVVPADDVPHYVVVSFIQDPCLVGTYAGIWGAEEV